VEVSGTILGGISQVGTQIPVDYFITQPLRTCFAIPLASLLAAAWDMRLHSIRRFWVDYLLPARPPTSTTPRARSLLDRFWRKCLLMILLTLSSTGLLWIALFSLMTQTFKPVLMLRIKIMAVVKVSLLIATLIMYKLRPRLIKLRRRLQGRRGIHDTPSMELPRFRREP
jgi:hypothetical protein